MTVQTNTPQGQLVAALKEVRAQLKVALEQRDKLHVTLQGLYDAVWEADPAARATTAARDVLLALRGEKTP